MVLLTAILACAGGHPDAPTALSSDGCNAVLGDRVFVAGGWGDGGTLTSLLETNGERSTGRASLPMRLYRPDCVPLGDGRVLLAGGLNKDVASARSFLYSPDTDLWEESGSMSTARHQASMLALADGRVLIAGGWSNMIGGKCLKKVELWNPEAGEWQPQPDLPTCRFEAFPFLRSDGAVAIVAGTTKAAQDPTAVNKLQGLAEARSIFILDSGLQAWSTLDGLERAPAYSEVVPLGGDRVLVAGGLDRVENKPVGTSQILDLKTGESTVTGAMKQGRFNHSLTALAGGDVVAIGGRPEYRGHVDLGTAERYDASDGLWHPWKTEVPERSAHRSFAVGAQVVIVGCREGDACPPVIIPIPREP